MTWLLADNAIWSWDGSIWTLVAVSDLDPQSFNALVFDRRRKVVVLFDGTSIHEWDGQSWTPRSAAGPVPRTDHALAFDETRAVTVLFGGYAQGYLNDTWEWDGETWTEVAVPQAPAPRHEMVMTYDSARHLIVLHGGRNHVTREKFSDTWEFDGQQWMLRTVDGPGAAVSMAFERMRQVTVLYEYAGWDGSRTWEWDGAEWTLLGVADPAFEQGDAMVYDEARNTCVRHGYLPNGRRVAHVATQEWNGSGWHVRAIQHPILRWWYDMVFDEARVETVMYGGRLTTYLDETWTWDGVTWRIHELQAPSAREYPRLAYDSWREVVVLFGGMGPEEGGVAHCCPRQDTWEWDGESWTIRALDGPPPRFGHGLAFDDRRGVVVLFGGSASELYESSDLLGDTWEWNGTTWSERYVTGPTPRAMHVMAFDRKRGVTVLHGGRTFDSFGGRETWEWDGQQWTLCGDSGPEVWRWGSSAYDSIREAVVVMIGSVLWEWTGHRWYVIGDAPIYSTEPDSAEIEFDSARGVLVAQGMRLDTSDNSGSDSDFGTWELAPGTVPLDVELDCDVDLGDVRAWQLCIGQRATSKLCYYCDSNKDGIISLDDLADIAARMSGPLE